MIPVSGDNNGCFPVLTIIHMRALANSLEHNSTTDNRSASVHQHADRPARGDTNHDASNFSGPSGATAVAKVENKDAPGRVRCSLLRRIFHKGKIKGQGGGIL